MDFYIELNGLIERIRNHINRADKQYYLLKDHVKWFSITTSIYVIEDTLNAIKYYLDVKFPADIGGKYLYIYGLLQACFLQQDAIRAISKTLFNREIDYKKDYPEAYAVRELRNRVAGHPIGQNSNEYIIINQSSIQKDGFKYLIEETTKDSPNFAYVNILKALQDMQKCIIDILHKVVNELDSEEREFKKKFEGEKMVEIFNGLDFVREKVLGDDVTSQSSYRSTRKMVDLCRAKVIERYGSLEALNSYEYCLKDLYSLYDLIDDKLNQVPGDIREEFASRLYELLFVKLEELVKLCKETDEYFSNPSEI